MSIDRPIFFVGVPRSGTTMISRTLALHEDLAWFSQYSDTFPRLRILSAVPRVYNLPFWPQGKKPEAQPNLSRMNRYLPKLFEPYHLWAHMCGEKFLTDYLIDVTASEKDRRRARQAVGWALRLQGKSRFVAKITGPVRMGYLASIFPDAIFLHVIRDGRAVVNSLLNVGWWKEAGGLVRPSWENGLPDGWEAEWKRFGSTPMALAAIQWRTILETAHYEKQQLEPGRCFEVRYEDFVSRPVKAIEQITTDCGLRPSQKTLEHVGQPGRYRDMNVKWAARFSKEEVRALHEIMGEWLERLGYSCRLP